MYNLKFLISFTKSWEGMSSYHHGKVLLWIPRRFQILVWGTMSQLPEAVLHTQPVHHLYIIWNKESINDIEYIELILRTELGKCKKMDGSIKKIWTSCHLAEEPTDAGEVSEPGGAGHLGDEADGHPRLLVVDQGGGPHFGGEVAAALSAVILTRAVNGTSRGFTATVERSFPCWKHLLPNL